MRRNLSLGARAKSSAEFKPQWGTELNGEDKGERSCSQRSATCRISRMPCSPRPGGAGSASSAGKEWDLWFLPYLSSSIPQALAGLGGRQGSSPEPSRMSSQLLGYANLKRFLKARKLGPQTPCGRDGPGVPEVMPLDFTEPWQAVWLVFLLGAWPCPKTKDSILPTVWFSFGALKG